MIASNIDSSRNTGSVESGALSPGAVRQVIRRAGADLFERHPFLKHQSAIGLAILLSAAIGIVTTWILYVHKTIPAVICIILVAFLASLIHEVEHDTIHRLYFKDRPLLRSAMLWVGWILRPNMPNPWFRESIHLHHHKHSGQPEDIEEQGIGNGSRYSFLRFLIMADVTFAIFLVPQLRRNSSAFKVLPAIAALFPLNVLFTGVWVSALAVHLWGWADPSTATGLPFITPALDALVVMVVAPGILRVFSLTFLSSSMHYFGGVDGVLTETQVLNRWYFLPFQLFSFWFGATHSIHHILVGQPFYVRHMIRRRCYPAMREAGVRFNDLGTFVRRNHYLLEDTGNRIFATP